MRIVYGIVVKEPHDKYFQMVERMGDVWVGLKQEYM